MREIILGDKNYKISFTLGALIEVEKELGVNFLKEISNPSVSSTMHFFYAGLVDRDPRPTFKEFVDEISFLDLGVVAESIVLELSEAFKKKEKKI